MLTGGDVAERHVSRGVLLESGRHAGSSFGSACLSAGFHAALVALAIRATGAPSPGVRLLGRLPVEQVSRIALAPAAQDRISRTAAAGTRRSTASTGTPIAPTVRIALSFSAPALPPPSPATALAPLLAAWSSPAGDASLGGGAIRHDEDGADPGPDLLSGQFAPPYPASLRDAHPDGRVLVRFVVDTTGRVDASSIRIVMATHRAFAESVRLAVPGLRFAPVLRGGRRITVRVERVFDFHCAC